MEKAANIMIDKTLFVDMCIYTIENADNDSPRYQRIEKGIQEKLDAMARHTLYSQYKAGATKEARLQARKEYLEMIGIPASFQWAPERDPNITHKPFCRPD